MQGRGLPGDGRAPHYQDAAGARRHPLGQTLIVTSGCGRVQREGGEVEEIRPKVSQEEYQGI